MGSQTNSSVCPCLFVGLRGLMAALSVVFLSCSHDDEPFVPLSAVEETASIPVGIEVASVSPSVDATRAGGTGNIDLSTLQSAGYGIGVCAHYTGNTPWETAKGSAKPDFMYNQQVTYLFGSSAWSYAPIKYWPNNNSPADNQGATSPQTHAYLSFFAYAPYVEVGTDGNVTDGSTTGIVGLTSNTTEGAPKVHFRTNTVDFTRQVDLLRAATPDQFKYDESGTHTEGNIDGQVKLVFQHALCQFKVEVERVYNETVDTDLHPDNASDTKIFVGKLSVAATGLYTDGWLNLADGTWAETDPSSPLTSFSYTTSDLCLPIQGVTDDPFSGTEAEKAAATARVRVYELNKWSTLYADDGTVHAADGDNTQVAGVIETGRPLQLTGHIPMLIPNATATLTPTITYSFVTRDNSLEHDYLTDSNGNRYSRIVHTITGAAIPFPSPGLQAGKIYTLRCRIGVESVEFEVTSVEDWDFPMRFTPTVLDYTDETGDWTNKTVNETDN